MSETLIATQSAMYPDREKSTMQICHFEILTAIVFFIFVFSTSIKSVTLSHEKNVFKAQGKSFSFYLLKN